MNVSVSLLQSTEKAMLKELKKKSKLQFIPFDFGRLHTDTAAIGKFDRTD